MVSDQADRIEELGIIGAFLYPDDVGDFTHHARKGLRHHVGANTSGIVIDDDRKIQMPVKLLEIVVDPFLRHADIIRRQHQQRVGACGNCDFRVFQGLAKSGLQNAGNDRDAACGRLNDCFDRDLALFRIHIHILAASGIRQNRIHTAFNDKIGMRFQHIHIHLAIFIVHRAKGGHNTIKLGHSHFCFPPETSIFILWGRWIQRKPALLACISETGTPPRRFPLPVGGNQICL